MHYLAHVSPYIKKLSYATVSSIILHSLDHALSKLSFAFIQPHFSTNYQSHYKQFLLQDRWGDDATELMLLVEGSKSFLRAFQQIKLIQNEHSLIRNISERTFLGFILQNKQKKKE